MKKCKLFFLVSLILVTSCAKDVIDLTGSIEGLVRSTGDNSLLEGCAVALEPGGASQITDANGYYCFADLEPNKYTLTFSKNGYKDAVKEITVLANKYLAVDVMLELKEVFSFSQEMIDFGDLQEVITFYVFNNSDKDCIFKVNNVPDWLKVAPVEGTINSESSKLITVTVDRSKVEYGKHSHTIVFDFTGGKSGQAQLPIRLEKVELTTPKVSCLSDAENITQNSFDIKGNILATGGSKIFRYGHCWSTNVNPTVDDNCTNHGTSTSICTFLSSIDNLGVATKYYVRAYAENSLGISYSEQVVVMTEDIHSEKWDGSVASSFGGGSGTYIDPYLIKTPSQLAYISVGGTYGAYYKVMNNLDLNNKSWKPIDNFNGTFDGNGKTILNLSIKGDKDDIGLFKSGSGTIENITIQNIIVQNISNNNTGALCGSFSGKIDNCHLNIGNGSIVGNKNVGGFVGKAKSVQLTNCTLTSNSSEPSLLGNECLGGIIGLIYDTASEFSNCKVNTYLNGEASVGGLIGYIDEIKSENLNINKCSFDGIIKGVDNIGGIVGVVQGEMYGYEQLKLTSVKSKLKIFADGTPAGGLIGKSNNVKVYIISSYSDVNFVNSSSYCGGLIGSLSCKYNKSSGKSEFNYSYSVVQFNGIVDKTINGGLVGYLSTGELIAKNTCTNYTTAGGMNKVESKFSADNCYQDCCNNEIVEYMQIYSSDYLSEWNFNNTYIWQGTVDDISKSVICPRLSWE